MKYLLFRWFKYCLSDQRSSSISTLKNPYLPSFSKLILLLPDSKINIIKHYKAFSLGVLSL